MENVEVEQNGYLENPSLKKKILCILFAPYTLVRINDYLFLAWFLSGMLVYIGININSKISKMTMCIIAYFVSVLIVLLALLVVKYRKRKQVST